jgi:hypothetical protein
MNSSFLAKDRSNLMQKDRYIHFPIESLDELATIIIKNILVAVWNKTEENDTSTELSQFFRTLWIKKMWHD